MTPQYPRGPQPTQPAEPGWWLASDGMWYPPELATPAPPTPEPTAPTTPEPTAPVASEPPTPVESAAPVMPEMAPMWTHEPEPSPAVAEAAPEAPAPTTAPTWVVEPSDAASDEVTPPVFADAPPVPPADSTPPAGQPGPADGSADAASARNGAGVAAFVLGLLSLVFGLLLGIPAVVCGLIGLRRPAKRWMAIVGLVLGSLTTIGSVVAVAVAVPVILEAADSGSKTTGLAAANTYGITIDECRLTATGVATVSGEVTNKTSKAKSFEVVVTLTDKESATERTTRTTLSKIPAKGTEVYKTDPEDFPRTTKAITCRVIEVRNAP